MGKPTGFRLFLHERGGIRSSSLPDFFFSAQRLEIYGYQAQIIKQSCVPSLGFWFIKVEKKFFYINLLSYTTILSYKGDNNEAPIARVYNDDVLVWGFSC